MFGFMGVMGVGRGRIVCVREVTRVNDGMGRGGWVDTFGLDGYGYGVYVVFLLFRVSRARVYSMSRYVFLWEKGW
jgi:hypothetical protein